MTRLQGKNRCGVISTFPAATCLRVQSQTQEKAMIQRHCLNHPNFRSEKRFYDGRWTSRIPKTG